MEEIKNKDELLAAVMNQLEQYDVLANKFISELLDKLEESQAQTKLFYDQLQKAEEKLARINELSEEEIDI